MRDRNRQHMTVESSDSAANDRSELSITLGRIEAMNDYETITVSLAEATSRRNSLGSINPPSDGDVGVSVTLHIFRDGEIVSVECGNEDFLGQNVLPILRQKLIAILESYHPKVLCFDLTTVKAVSAEMLGLFVTMHNTSAKVVLLNPSEQVRHAVETTRLDTLLEMIGNSPSGN